MCYLTAAGCQLTGDLALETRRQYLVGTLRHDPHAEAWDQLTLQLLTGKAGCGPVPFLQRVHLPSTGAQGNYDRLGLTGCGPVPSLQRVHLPLTTGTTTFRKKTLLDGPGVADPSPWASRRVRHHFRGSLGEPWPGDEKPGEKYIPVYI